MKGKCFGLTTILALFAVSFALLACQSASQPESKSAPAAVNKQEKSEVIPLKVGILPVGDLAPLYIANKQGYFADAGLSVTTTPFASGNETLSAAFAGKLDIVYTGAIPWVQALDQGFDPYIIAGNSTTRAGRPDAFVLLVKTDGPIKSLKDLEGKRIATNAINNNNWLYTVATLRKNGVDPTKVTFTELPFPQMNDTLLGDKVDAITQVEPFHTILVGSGKATALAYPYVDVQPNFHVGFYVATGEWLKSHGDAARKFAQAIGKANEFYKSNESDARKTTAEVTKIDPAIVAKMIENAYLVKVDAQALQKSADLALEYKLLKNKLDVGKFVYETAK